MKSKFITILGVLTLLGCSKDDEKNCNCNRVIEPVSHFNLPNGQSFGGYQTKNDCSGEVKNHQYTGTPPRVGDCK